MEKPTKTPKRNKKPKEEVIEQVEELALGEEEGAKQSPLGKLTPFIMPLLIAGAISFFLINILAVPKGTYNNAITGLSSRMAEIETNTEELVDTQEGLNTSIGSLEAKLTNYQANSINQSELDALANKVNNLKSQLSNLDTQVTGLVIPSQADLTATIDSEFTEYETRITDMESLLEELALIDEEGNPATTGEIVRWYPQVYCTNYNESTIEVDLANLHISPSRIEDDDDYSILLPLLNHTEETKSDVIVSVVFSPKSGSRTVVDDDEIYLDSVYSPFTYWAMDIVTRSDGTCRRIVFTSEKIRVPAGAIVDEVLVPGRLDLRLEFTLAYK